MHLEVSFSDRLFSIVENMFFFTFTEGPSVNVKKPYSPESLGQFQPNLAMPFLSKEDSIFFSPERHILFHNLLSEGVLRFDEALNLTVSINYMAKI